MPDWEDIIARAEKAKKPLAWEKIIEIVSEEYRGISYPMIVSFAKERDKESLELALKLKDDELARRLICLIPSKNGKIGDVMTEIYLG